MFTHAIRGLLRTLLALGWCGLSASLVLAQQEADKKEQPEVLPLNKVVMFNSGVGYFEHRGNVDGDAKIDLRFRVEEINDLLKSMILEDRGGEKFRRSRMDRATRSRRR